ncbi:Putative peptidoglycan binding domain-containing protein [Friedmanniella luteola]|uniref:Putative peptidoglycan binding domain-containing protein n=1 Tax=Friedmanniella luteola TaxID=546871 RepID=A0A1H1ZNH4_9ACTN|nr:peptidoglycan-binding domain-containing protein [Friedmanniella luteola]SDT35220.1 Putative peptidoglycan binding domain-containing protein [Friedmanniella luteola]
MLRKLALPLFSLLTLLGLVVVAAPAHAAPAPVLPVVDMTALTAAAHVEGYRGNQPGLGDDPSTRLVQRALTAKGFRVVADGHYGRATTAAYIKYQRSLGYKGVDANGIPGPQSLARLGKGRFAVARVVQVGSRNDRYGTKRVNSRTRQMLTAADATLAWKITVSQGSYCILTKAGCAKASAGTHDAGGTIDIKVSSLSTTERWKTVQALRKVGFAAWLRLPSQCGGCWPAHIHATAIGDTDLWQKNGRYTNRDQVADYYVGRNGLAGHAKDNTPTRYRAPFTTWERYAGIV